MQIFRIVSRYGGALTLLFLLLTASAYAVEEASHLRSRTPVEQWCSARAHINFNTWQLLVNLGNAVVAGEATLTTAEELEFEESSRYRLRKAVFDANDARRTLLDFVRFGATPTSNPWPSDMPEYTPYNPRHGNSTRVDDDRILSRWRRRPTSWPSSG